MRRPEPGNTGTSSRPVTSPGWSAAGFSASGCSAPGVSSPGFSDVGSSPTGSSDSIGRPSRPTIIRPPGPNIVRVFWRMGISGA